MVDLDKSEVLMASFDAKISPKGQLTVPVEVRRLIGLEAGGVVQFQTDDEGRVILSAKKRSIMALKGLFPKPSSPVDVDEAITLAVMREQP